MKILFDRLSSIYSGWLNYFKDKLGLISPDQKELFDERLSICMECEHNVCNICSLCGCPVKKKTKSITETCPDNRWKPMYYLKDWDVVIATEDVPEMLRKKLFDFLGEEPEFINQEKWELFLDSF